MPNGWALNPAGTQVLTNRGTTGVAVSPDGKSIYATTSGIFEEAVVHIDASSLVPVPTLASDTFQGVLADRAGNVWVSGGPANAVWQYKAVGPALLDVRLAGPVPDLPNLGIPVTGYPGNMTMAGHWLAVAGNLSVPNSLARSASGGAPCPGSNICSVINTIDVSNPDALHPATHAIPVGRDAYQIAYRPGSGTAPPTLYVSNWADQTNPSRSGGAGVGTISVVKFDPNTGTGKEVQVVPVGTGPTGLSLSPDGATLVTADTGSDQLSVLSVDPATATLTRTQTISVSPGPGQPLGAEPVATAFSPDGHYLYVTLAGLNAVEVFNVSAGRLQAIPQHVMASFNGHTHAVTTAASYIPTGWYPDALAVGPEPSGTGQRLYVANLRGRGAGPGFYGQVEPLVGSSTEGSVSAIDLPSGSAQLSRSLNRWTSQVVNNDQMAPLLSATFPDPATNPCLAAPLPGGGSVQSQVLCDVSKGTINPKDLHVVVIEAENKTFDSYFGDTGATLPEANASPVYNLYGAAVTTNQHLLAQSYSVNDNFWNEGAEASTLGHSWLSGSYTTLDRELTWGMDYSQNLRGQRSNGQYAAPPLSLSGPTDPAVNAQEQTMLDPRNLLINEAYRAGLSVRLLGTDINPGSPVAAAGDQVPQNLWGEAGSGVSSDLAWPDVDRAAMFLHGRTISHAWDLLDGAPPPNFLKPIAFSQADYQKFSLDAWKSSYRTCMASHNGDAKCQQSMPNLTYMQLPENHTYVVSNVLNPLDPTPQSMVADNDYAIGQIVDGLSHSPFWKNTIVFVTEDDNQFTGDHVDIHRTFLLTAGGMARKLGPSGQVSSQTGSFPSIDKTTEVLLGLKPLTYFDARAVPLQQVVANRTGASMTPYNAVYPLVPFLAGRTDSLGSLLAPIGIPPLLPGLPPSLPGLPALPGSFTGLTGPLNGLLGP